MKVVTTNLLNRFWKNGVKPIKDALTNKVDSSKIVNSLLTTAAGFALDARQGKVLDDKITELNRKSKVKVYKKTYTVAASSTSKVETLTNATVGIPSSATIEGIIALAQTGEPHTYTASTINNSIYVRNGWAGGSAQIPVIAIVVYTD